MGPAFLLPRRFCGCLASQPLPSSGAQLLRLRCVNGRNAPLRYWYYYLPDYLLAVLMYTLLGRALLGLMVDAASTNYIWRFFCRITDPIVAAVGVVTPKAAAPVVVWLFGVVWLFWLRVALLYAFLVLTAGPRPA